MTVNLAEVLKDKALKSGDLFSEQRTKSSFVEEQPSNVCDNKYMYWAARRVMNSRVLAQYADALM